MPYDVPHAVSPSLWVLAWKRLLADRVAMVSLAIVAAFLLMMLLSGTGLIAKDWSREVGVNYAPPSFAGADAESAAPAPAAPAAGAPSSDASGEIPVVDPLADALAAIRGEAPKATSTEPSAAEGQSVDPLADVMADIKAKGTKADAVEARRSTLPFGGDKWGRDVLKKTIKGSETSIFVGLAAAVVATFLGTVFGAMSGYYGRWLDDIFNWFYSVFTSIPYLLLILAVAAVLQQKGTLTIILILGLTGWTGVFRLIRGEYLKHKGREYVQAADAIGASNVRRMFVHIFPNISHVVLVQLSILTVAFIKSEVILSFLGFGVPVDVVSWGSMLNEAQNELILGKWWQLAAAGTAMALLVTAFSLFTDALRDALDPKLK
ncbi:MAG: ABC transporter permease [Betaproteobacteria bacterium]|nr:MAG: ABC transporter permease [Betaproteobacteria bacterium]TMH04123.1 MAG: ABC transporter permease [Betaproteobacteria bacterium]